MNDEIAVPEELKDNVFTTTLSQIYGWGRKYSLWPVTFGLACCAFEFMAAAGPRFDFGRFGMDLARASPRQADLLVVSGTVTKKMVPQIVRIYNQMAEPKYVMSMGACANGGGPFKEGYNVVSGVDRYVPVDVYIPGCPPTPQALLHGLITLQRRIDQQHWKSTRWYSKEPLPEIPIPVLGPDVMDPRQYDTIRNFSNQKLTQEQTAGEAAETSAAVE
jgi:NADH-quinone oxidoreductase subunit B